MSPRIKKLLQVSLLLTLAGWANALYTLIHRQSLLAGSLEGESFCNIGKAFNCDAVALSSYSTLAGVPVSAWGMAFYGVALALAAWAFFAAQDGHREKLASASTALLAFSAFGLLPSLWLAFASFFLLGTVCLLCLLTYALNIGLVVTALLIKRESPSPVTKGRFGFVSDIPQALWITSIALTALHLFAPKIVSSTVAERGLDDAAVQHYVARHFQEAPKSILPTGYPFLGPENAPVTMVEYSDFQCPFCKRASLTLPSVVAARGGQVKLVFKHYPLDPSCNPAMKGHGHPYACLAAKTAQCAFTRKGNEAFWTVEKALFDAQEKISPEAIQAAGMLSGLTAEELKACVDDSATHDAVVAQAVEGTTAGVQGTPALYINGKLAEGGTLPLILQPILDQYKK